MRKALHRLLRSAGYEVEALDGAGAFLERSAPVPPACLVLDIRMPGMSGIDLQKAIQGTSHDLPIIFITGHGDEDERNVAVASGAVDVLAKPLDQDVLIEAIERGLKRCRPCLAGSPCSSMARMRQITSPARLSSRITSARSSPSSPRSRGSRARTRSAACALLQDGG